MKTQKLVGLAALALTSGIFTGCDLLGDIEYTVEPCPIEMHADSVEVKITAKVPEKGMKKKAFAKITPMLGDKALKTVAYQGEKASGEGSVIPFKTGGTITYRDKIAYTPDLENSELMVKVVASKGEESEKTKDYNSDKLCDGTIITPYLVQNDDKVLFGSDEFVRVTEHDSMMVFNFLKGKFNMRKTELTDADYVAFKSFVAWAIANPKIEMMAASSDGFASPEGENAKNVQLSKDRATAGAQQLAKLMTELNYEPGKAEGFCSTRDNGEDVAGFKKLVSESNIEDKDIILNVVNSYTDAADEQIKALSKTYKELENDILPQLRRAKINMHYKNLGKTDDEMKALSVSKPDSLTIEELLFTAALYEDLNEKLRVYKEAERLYPNDWRGANNVGYILFLQGDVAKAGAQFDKAAGLDADIPIIKNNIGAVTRQGGDRVKALALFEESTSAGKEVSYNIGITNIQDAKYNDAVTNFGSANTFNKALAQVLSGDLDGALSTLDASADKETGIGYYLKAIIGARKNDVNMTVNNLKSAISKDSSLKDKASKDREFLAFFENEAFKTAVN